MNPVIHFEMPYTDARRVAAFCEPMEIPGVGRYVAFRDTEGNRASLLQP